MAGSVPERADAGPIAPRVMAAARDSLSAMGGRTVYGEPIERGDVTVIPASRVWGGSGGGGGSGSGPDGHDMGEGGGGGLGITARPVGAFVITADNARWEPAVDPTRMAAMRVVVGLGAIWAWRSVARTWAKRR